MGGGRRMKRSRSLVAYCSVVVLLEFGPSVVFLLGPYFGTEPPSQYLKYKFVFTHGGVTNKGSLLVPFSNSDGRRGSSHMQRTRVNI